jgi:hypothetical protein
VRARPRSGPPSPPSAIPPAARLGARKGRVAEVGKRRPAPELGRVPELLRRLGGRTAGEVGPSVVDHALEPLRIQLLALDTKQVPRAAGDEQTWLKELSQLRDAVLNDLRRRRRRIALPELVDQAIARDDLVRVQEQHRQQLSLTRAPQRYLPNSRADLERTEDPVIHFGY